MRTIGGSMLTHLNGSTTTLATIVKVTRVDGLIYGLTGHDRALTYLGLRYETGEAAPELAALIKSAGISVDNTEVMGAISDTVEIDDIEAGDWNSARLEVMRVNWRDLTMGIETLGVGELGQVHHDNRAFKVEFMGRAHRLGRTITRTTLPTCDADLGDARCGVDIEPLAEIGAVTVVTSNRIFTAVVDGSPPSTFVTDFHTYGRLLWLTGENIGRAMEVQSNTTSLFTLQLGMKREVQVGDTFKSYPGCNKLKKTGPGVYLGDCVVKFANAVNFRGFDEVPGIDAIVRPAGV